MFYPINTPNSKSFESLLNHLLSSSHKFRILEKTQVDTWD